MATKWGQNGDRMEIKWRQNEDKMWIEWRQNRDKMETKWRQNGDKMETAILTLFWPFFVSICPNYFPIIILWLLFFPFSGSILFLF